MKFAVLDLNSSPPCIVLLTSNATEAEDTAQRYANQNGYAVTLADVAASETIAPSGRMLAGSPRLLVAEDFASAEDARKAGFAVPFGLIRATSDDVAKATSDDVAKKKPTK